MKHKIMITILLKTYFRKTSLLMASLGLVFFVNSQTQSGTQTFIAQGSDSNPAVISFSIPNDITVNNGVGIQSIEITNVSATVDVVDVDPIVSPLINAFIGCGDLYSFNLSLDGTTAYTEVCQADIQGEDITNNTTVEMSSVAASLIPDFPLPIIPDFDIEISLTIKVTYNTCSANAGVNTTITPCKNEPIFLFDEMDGSPQSDGVWNGPSGDIISIASITTPNLAGIYTYTYTVEDGPACSDQATLTIDVQECDYLSVGTEQLESVSVYPNPTSNVLNIEGITEEGLQITVQDLSGRVVQPKVVSNSNTALDLTGLQNGIYLVQIIKDNAQKVIRVVKQ